MWQAQTKTSLCRSSFQTSPWGEDPVAHGRNQLWFSKDLELVNPAILPQYKVTRKGRAVRVPKKTQVTWTTGHALPRD